MKTEDGAKISDGAKYVSDGKAEAQPKQTKDKVNSIEQWTQAFFIFMGIYLSRCPDKASELLNNSSVIRDAAENFLTMLGVIMMNGLE